MKSLVVANWKCNPITLKEARRIFNSVEKGTRSIKDVEVVICPPFIYLFNLTNLSQFSTLGVGAQNCFWKEKGAYTGEISPWMLKDLGCEYVIIGHSERRKYFQETDEMINKKIKVSLDAGLKPIFCIGETEQEKERDQTQEILNSQMRNGLKGIADKEIQDVTLAYEPVWAIGTGKACSIEDAMSACLFIRRVIAVLYNKSVAESLRILYGGSVTSANAASYIKQAKMNGLLVGGASLKPEEFIKIIKAAQP